MVKDMRKCNVWLADQNDYLPVARAKGSGLLIVRMDNFDSEDVIPFPSYMRVMVSPNGWIADQHWAHAEQKPIMLAKEKVNMHEDGCKRITH